MSKRNKTSTFIEEYESVAYDLYGKLNEHNISQLREEILDGKDSYESEIYKEYNDKKFSRYYMLENPEEEKIEEGVFTCSKCSCKRISIRTQQTRGGDESTTVFYTCVKCKNHWRT